MGLGLGLSLSDYKVHAPFILQDYIFIGPTGSKLSINISVNYSSETGGLT